jgi:glycine reductase
LQQLLAPGAMVRATLVSGDNFAAERTEEFRDAVREALEVRAPDVVIAGPAFNAGRYGLACGSVCEVAADLGIRAITAMYPENPGVTLYRRNVVILRTASGAVDMERALGRLANAALREVPLGPPWEEDSVPHGFRRLVLREQTAAERALDMLAARLRGEKFETEIPIPEVTRVNPAPPLEAIERATIAVVTTSALVPRGNPDRLRQSYSTEWRKYSLEGLTRLDAAQWESIHGGFDTASANLNPHVVLPLDALRMLEGTAYGRLHPAYYVTAGVGTAVSEAQRMGAEIAAELVAADVGGVVLTAT